MKMNKHNNIYIYLIILILVLTFSYFIFYSIQNEKMENIPTEQFLLTETIKEEIIEKKQDVFTYEEALISGDVTNCDLIIDINKQNICKSKLGVCTDDSCLYSDALDSGKITDCYNIKDETLKLKCSFETHKTNIFDDSVSSKNILICDELSGDILIQRCKDNYYYVDSINSNNISLCDKVIQVDLKEACYNEHK